MKNVEMRPHATNVVRIQESLEQQSVDPESLDPIDVVKRVHALRVQRRWFELEENVVPGQRSPLRELVLATDALLDANARLYQTIVEVHGLGAATPFDRSQAGNAIGVFSTDVEILNQRIDGKRASVTIQVAERVPLQEVELTRRDDRWLIQTDPPIEELPRQIEKLAGVMNEAAARLEREALSMDELHTWLASEQAPVLQRIAKLTSEKP